MKEGEIFSLMKVTSPALARAPWLFSGKRKVASRPRSSTLIPKHPREHADDQHFPTGQKERGKEQRKQELEGG